MGKREANHLVTKKEWAYHPLQDIQKILAIHTLCHGKAKEKQHINDSILIYKEFSLMRGTLGVAVLAFF